jgi:hypothetical protein
MLRMGMIVSTLLFSFQSYRSWPADSSIVANRYKLDQFSCNNG